MKQQGLICGSIQVADAEAVVEAILPMQQQLDVVEIRLDGMRDPRIDAYIEALDLPLLVTNRPTWEGGQFAGEENERIDILCQAIEAGARYVDMELGCDIVLQTQILTTARQNGTRVIVSNHDFHLTPSTDTLETTLKRMQESGAGIGKIVTTAQSPADTLRVLNIQQKALAHGFPLSAFAMGPAGKISRLATLYLGGFMTYAALSKEQATAPGQLCLEDLHALLNLLNQEQ